MFGYNLPLLLELTEQISPSPGYQFKYKRRKLPEVFSFIKRGRSDERENCLLSLASTAATAFIFASVEKWEMEELKEDPWNLGRKPELVKTKPKVWTLQLPVANTMWGSRTLWGGGGGEGGRQTASGKWLRYISRVGYVRYATLRSFLTLSGKGQIWLLCILCSLERIAWECKERIWQLEIKERKTINRFSELFIVLRKRWN